MLMFDNGENGSLAGRFVRPLCFACEGNEYYGLRMIEVTHGAGPTDRNIILGFQGSCTLIKYHNRYFVLFTRHQIAEIDGETREQFTKRMNLLYVLMDDGRDSTNLPIRNLIMPAMDPIDADRSDFVIGVIETAMLTPFMVDQFFPVDDRHFGAVGSYALASGFASAEQRVLMEIGGLHTPIGVKSGNLTRREVGSTATMNYPADGLSVDGYSGGAVITIGKNIDENRTSEFVAHFNGLIQRGGNGFIHFLTTERITLQVDIAIALGNI